MKKRYLFLLSLLLTVFLGACGEQASQNDASDEEVKETLKLYTTVYPLMDFVEKIGGDHVEVESILPPGADSHTFEPDTKQMIEVAEADGFIYSGAGLEAYAEKISNAVEAEDVKILEASEGIDLENHEHQQNEEDGGHDEHDDEESHAGEEDDGHGHGDNDKDPHVWLDPVLSIQLAANIKDLLVELKPEEEETFEENFNNLKTDLEELDHSFANEIKAQSKNKIIVSHAAYGYWEHAYGLEQIAVSGLSPTEEPSQKQLEKIIKVAEDNDLKYVLFEQNVTPKVSEVVQKEINGEALRIHNLSVLTDNDIEDDEDYFSLMYRNLEVLKKALQ
ncbi:adhesin [Thalassobacillus devorans]|uniref:Adhesin n=1 Tax=Thalassobacillus devorans TaxID=279813 RepID=A0ABQ1PVA4_9BACI|nr:zinc ABC transporter substrate-binding protein [Thalassobacillus devorans]NIK30827.1 zinc transport system substrate-binding protein [Thalassobacillus devorans]GGD04586.1 adhesin [Thalassobacillus devorans]